MALSVSDTALSKKPHYRLFPSMRLAIVGFVFLGVTLTTAAYSALNFVIVCMVNSTTVRDESVAVINSTNSTESTPPVEVACNGRLQASDEMYNGQLNWDRAAQARVLSGVMWGSMIFVVPSGAVMDRYGARVTYSLAGVLMAVTTLLIPTAAEHGTSIVFITRLIFGLGNSLNWPLVMAICAQWVPVADMGMLMSLTACGFQTGTLISMASSGFLCVSVGWRNVFYLWGSVILIWTVVFAFFYANPENHHLISKQEADYVLAARGTSKVKGNFSALPLKSMITSLPVWAIVINTTCSWYFSSQIGMFLPTYLKEVLFLGARSNGMYAALPYVCQFIGRCVGGIVSDKLVRWSPTVSVKVFTVICQYLPAGLATLMTLWNCSTVSEAITNISIMMFFFGMITGSYIKSTALIAPRYASTISGLAGTGGALGVIAMTYVVGALTAKGSMAEWQIVQYIAAGVLLAGSTVFMVFGSGELQPWAIGEEQLNSSTSKKAGVVHKESESPTFEKF